MAEFITCEGATLRSPTAPIARPTHRIDLTCMGRSSKGLLWNIVYADKVIIERARMPALDVCQYLLAIGITGKLLVYRNGQHQFTISDIKRGARCTVTEGSTKGLTLEPYKAFPGGAAEDNDWAKSTGMPVAASPGGANYCARTNLLRVGSQNFPGR
jgi:hypothetical protein